MAKKDKAEQQGRIIPLSAFGLKKVKITKEGVDVTHHESGTNAGEIIKKGEVQPHPDLKAALDQLQLYMAQRLGLTQGWDFAREHLKKDHELLKLAMDQYTEALNRCNVNGIKLVGEGETYGVQITASLKTPGGGSTGLAVPKITLGTTPKLGYEPEVQVIVDLIKSEVYKYRFQGKKLQQELKFEEDNKSGGGKQLEIPGDKKQ